MAEAAVAAMKQKALTDRASHAWEARGGRGGGYGNGSGGGGGKGGREGGTSSSTSEGGVRRITRTNGSGNGRNNVFGNVAPSVPVGMLHIELADDSGQIQQGRGHGHGHGRYYDQESGSHRSAGGGGSATGGEAEDVLEHDYGDTGRAEVGGGGGEGGGGLLPVFRSLLSLLVALWCNRFLCCCCMVFLNLCRRYVVLYIACNFVHCFVGGGGIMCDWQSFADGADGAFSEFGGQSEYDPVVPGGSVNDGMSDEDSSRWVPLVC